MRGSRRLDAKALHAVSAFATQLSVVVGDLAVAPEENEITTALALLKELPLAGAIITGDAIFCQREVCRNDHRRTRRLYVLGEKTTSPR